LSPSYKNPADTKSNEGAKLTISPTTLWNRDMWRTELFPQSKAALGSGKRRDFRESGVLVLFPSSSCRVHNSTVSSHKTNNTTPF
jgi:hypothetical protein